MIIYIKPTPDGGFTALQRQQVPAVYLDLCALRIVAESSELAARFVAAMRRASASLLISSMTIYEFVLLSDMRHARAVDSLLQQLFRHLYFIQCEPITVIAKEEAVMDGAVVDAPHADAELFRQTLILGKQQDGPLELTSLLSSRGGELRSGLTDFMLNVRRAFELLKNRVDTEPEIRRNADRALKALGDRKMATRALFTALIKPLHDDRLPSENDTVDLMHAVVPASYAELVVLDGKWTSAIEQATKRIRRMGYTASIARPFSPRNQGIEAFLSALEMWPLGKGD